MDKYFNQNSLGPASDDTRFADVGSSGSVRANPIDGGEEVSESNSVKLFVDTYVEVRELDRNFFVPTDWLEEDQTTINVALQWWADQSDAVKMTPWIFSSGKKALNGDLRTSSPDHMSGRAFDVAPMYSADTILPADPPMSALAMSWLKMLLLAEPIAAGKNWLYAIEGDHVHVWTSRSNLLSDKGLLLAVATGLPAYQSGRSLMQAAPWLSDIVKIPMVLNLASLTFGPSVELEERGALKTISGAQLLSDILDVAEQEQNA